MPAAASAATGDLFLQQAPSGTLSAHKLTLRGVAPRVTTFTDRPQRRASSQPVAGFVSGWRTAFGVRAPNAALEIAGAPAGRDVSVLELRAPRYGARHRTLTYRVRRIAQAGGGLAPLDRRADARVRGAFKHATLYIDDAGEQGAGQVFVTLSAPSGQQTSLTFSDARLDFGPQQDAISYTPLTPATAPQLIITPTSLTATASNGDGGVLVQGWLEVSDGQTAITGTASVPAGGGASFQLSSGGPQTLADGSFSIPLS